MWTTFNGSNGNGKIRIAVSRDRGATFSKAVTITPPGDHARDDVRLPLGRQ